MFGFGVGSPPGNGDGLTKSQYGTLQQALWGSCNMTH